MSGHIGWSDFWGILKKDTAEVATKWYAALGDDFAGWVVSRGPKVVLEIIGDAPIGVVLLFIHLLPRELAKKVAMNFPAKHHGKLDAAWQKRETNAETSREVEVSHPSRDLPEPGPVYGGRK